jgi:3'-phosphoadenosine 5'-phosphosulfate (PAPS) 3'-phosphatase
MEEAFSGARVRRTFSAGIKLALVARGEADIYPTRGTFHDWDLAAGQILVEEAGGTVTTARGDALRYGNPGALQNRGVLATNGRLHETALATIRGLR